MLPAGEPGAGESGQALQRPDGIGTERGVVAEHEEPVRPAPGGDVGQHRVERDGIPVDVGQGGEAQQTYPRVLVNGRGRHRGRGTRRPGPADAPGRGRPPASGVESRVGVAAAAGGPGKETVPWW